MIANAFIALTALAMASLVHVIAVVVWLTRLDMRLKMAEGALNDMKGSGERLMRIETEMNGLRDDVRHIGAGLEWLRNVPGYSPPTRSAKA